jgi:predicted permease
MLLPLLFFLLGAASGFALFRLASARRLGRPQSAGLMRLATVLAFTWFVLSALLFAWAAWRFAAAA